MGAPYFRFKQFTVWHDRCAMKVGTDGVLLGAWTDVSRARRLLDAGTGTGLISLMLAQRCGALITAVEIDTDAALQASENASRSPWSDRIRVVRADFKTYTCTERYDTIVSNPPYFVHSLKCPAGTRNSARHDDELSYTDLFQSVSRLLAPQGTFSLIIPATAEQAVEHIAEGVLLHPLRRLAVMTKRDAAPKRVLLSFSFEAPGQCTREELLIELERHRYSPEFLALTSEFYL